MVAHRKVAQPCRDAGQRAARSAQLVTIDFCIWSSLFTVADVQHMRCSSLREIIQWTGTQHLKQRRRTMRSALPPVSF